ncbi:MAG: DUF4340 domain-containing protein [Gammaproteobacteria bacterium]|nr:DUF4340 domain-containing protein [Gammaproteobacteria bacterium]
MTHKLLINLLLLLLVAGLGLLAWLQPGKEAEAQLQPLTSRSPAEVRRLVIQPTEGANLSFERQAGRWQMTEPYAMPANAVKLDALARVVEAPMLNSFPLVEERRAEFGLDRPIRLQLDELEFAFGGNDPINYHRYVGFNGQLALIVDRFFHHLSAPAEQLLSPGLLPEGARLSEIQTPKYRLQRGQGGWQLEPANPKLGGDELSGQAEQWAMAQGLAVERFESVEPADQTAGQVQIRLDSGAQFSFKIVQRDQATWLVRSDNGIGYRLPAETNLLEPPQPPAPTPADSKPDA